MSIELLTDELDQDQFKPFEVKNPKDGFRYRFLNINERNIAQKQAMGYQIVGSTDEEQLVISESTPIKRGAQLDTTRRFSDVVLARIPEEKYQRIVRRNAALQERRSMRAVFDQLRSEAPGAYKEESKGSYSGQMTESQFNASNTGKG
ncbi:MAG: hypothetical protein C5B60_03910 [Chloroflexi bacterium]|nr:MAG: hypothetical protein C5B60_03910 [Chloroflexota bacterium]